jgi:hypothetical protein
MDSCDVIDEQQAIREKEFLKALSALPTDVLEMVIAPYLRPYVKGLIGEKKNNVRTTTEDTFVARFIAYVQDPSIHPSIKDKTIRAALEQFVDSQVGLCNPFTQPLLFATIINKEHVIYERLVGPITHPLPGDNTEQISEKIKLIHTSVDGFFKDTISNFAERAIKLDHFMGSRGGKPTRRQKLTTTLKPRNHRSLDPTPRPTKPQRPPKLPSSSQPPRKRT